MDRNFKILRMVLGSYATNCYVIFSENDAVIIDPAANAQAIIDALNENNITPTKIFLTHAHPDHFGALDNIREQYGIEAYICEKDEKMLEERSKELKNMLGKYESIKADKYYKSGDKILFENTFFEVIETPGHTPGGVCLKIDDILFSGDTLFLGSIGRTDLPGGNFDVILQSLDNLMKLDSNVIVLPGHGDSTAIGYEKIHNPFIRKL